ncbi:hypothetical protein B0H16DRAFT_1018461 [Mycena metata]|uniref:Uncharacterized protein n=1 Tax=Mycena metata TaxID=1033252 RepID=A0AAD7II62_9AGAR|nr:hypothetical protein B0H16DRAFT_1018461 [Mycena metata]
MDCCQLSPSSLEALDSLPLDVSLVMALLPSRSGSLQDSGHLRSSVASPDLRSRLRSSRSAIPTTAVRLRVVSCFLDMPPVHSGSLLLADRSGPYRTYAGRLINYTGDCPCISGPGYPCLVTIFELVLLGPWYRTHSYLPARGQSIGHPC